MAQSVGGIDKSSPGLKWRRISGCSSTAGNLGFFRRGLNYAVKSGGGLFPPAPPWLLLQGPHRPNCGVTG